jgi:hypothetical protein
LPGDERSPLQALASSRFAAERPASLVVLCRRDLAAPKTLIQQPELLDDVSSLDGDDGKHDRAVDRAAPPNA